jgi:signal transduction histidine kinase
MSSTRVRVFLGACLLAVAVTTVVGPGPGSVLAGAVGVAATAAIVAGSRIRPRDERAAWYLLAAGMAANVLGDALWATTTAAGEPAPFTSIADVAYVAAYPLWVAGLALLARRRGGRADPSVLIDALILATSAAVLGWVFVIQPRIGDELPLDELLLSAWYTIADVVLIALLTRIVLGVRSRTAGDRLLLAGLVAQLAADILYAGTAAEPGFDAGPVAEVGWLLFYACWGAAALTPLTPVARDAGGPMSPPVRLAFAAAVFVTPVLLVVEVARGRHEGDLAIAIGMAVTIALTGMRVGIMFATVERHARDLDEQRRALRRTLGDLRAAETERTHLLDRTVRATEEERARVAVDLHDGPIQQMTALGFRMGTLRARLRASDGAGAEAAIDTVEREIGDSIRELRRLMSDLRPPALDQGGLEAALRDQVARFRLRTGLDATFESTLEGELEPDTQVVLYRITQEALTNVTKHARATRVAVRLSTPNHHATLEVSDDGVGFDETLALRRARDGHFGLAAMDQRATMVGGRLDVRSAPGGGTRIIVDVPIRSPM